MWMSWSNLETCPCWMSQETGCLESKAVCFSSLYSACQGANPCIAVFGVPPSDCPWCSVSDLGSILKWLAEVFGSSIRERWLLVISAPSRKCFLDLWLVNHLQYDNAWWILMDFLGGTLLKKSSIKLASVVLEVFVTGGLFGDVGDS